MIISRIPFVSTRSGRYLRRFVAFSTFYFLVGVIFLKLPVIVVDTTNDHSDKVSGRDTTLISSDSLSVELGYSETVKIDSFANPRSPSSGDNSSSFTYRDASFPTYSPSSTDTRHDLPEQTGNFNGEQLVVHVTWFYPPRTDFRFHEALCLLAIQRYVRPRKILFWYDSASTPPSGVWWQFARQSVAHLLPVPVERPTSVFNRTVHVPEHQSDLIRLAVLEDLGGLYVDLDLIVVRPIDELLRYIAVLGPSGSAVPMSSSTEVIMGAETPEMLGSGFILSPRPKSEFIHRWRRAYADGFVDSDWNRHSVYVPMELARQHPELVHVEWFAINRPNWFEREWLYSPGRLWDWSANYALHLWFRDRPVGDVDYDPVTIRALNTTVGEVFRHIYYGHTELLPPHLDQ